MTNQIFYYYCSSILNAIFQNPFVQANPIALAFVISFIPQIFLPIPKSEFIIPILTNGADATGVLIATTVANLLGEILLYYLAKHGSNFLKKKEMKRDIEIKRFIHKYSFLFFIISPFVPIGTDILVIFAGIRKVRLRHIVVPMAIGFALKNALVIILVLQGLYFLPQILRVCTSF